MFERHFCRGGFSLCRAPFLSSKYQEYQGGKSSWQRSASLHTTFIVCMLLALKVEVIWRTWVHLKGNFLGFLFCFVFQVRLQRNLNFKCSITFLLNDCSYLCQVTAPIQGEAILIPLQAGPLMKRRLKFLLHGIAHDECFLSCSLSQAHISGLRTKLYRRLLN